MEKKYFTKIFLNKKKKIKKDQKKFLNFKYNFLKILIY